mmetsp:Transcript_26630/g.85358  ORF Transcript_26630/g.85358 Transcript_26630/m.85358 type:complete len:123 (+) Transcript_26630:746-1114(+)
MLLWVAIGGQSPAGMPQMAENEDPLNFNPERWLTSEPGEAPEMTTKIPEAFMTFGAGKRICPGKALAEAEIGYMVYKLARDVDFEVSVPLEPGQLQRGQVVRFTRRAPAVAAMADPAVVAAA